VLEGVVAVLARRLGWSRPRSASLAAVVAAALALVFG
jgi:hypothetical protein